MKEASTYLFKRYIAQASEFTPFTIEVAKGEGVYIWDTKGKKYIDFISSICVNNVGHRNNKVIEALQKQMQSYLHIMVYGEFIQKPQLDLAQRICENLPAQLQKIFFLNSGSEAIEGAIKLSRLYNGRKEIISFKNSYHGSTMGAMSVLGNKAIQQVFKPLLPKHKLLEYNKEEDLQKITTETCCVIAEAIQSGAGMITPKNDFLKKLRKRCTQTGTLLIFDEIQTGFGRCGSLFAFQSYHAIPDILCVAKGMGGGMPISAFIASEALMELLQKEHPLLGHATTFGGHPLSCVASLATLNILLEDSFLNKVNEKGERIRQHLQEIPEIVEVKGRGLFLSAWFKDSDTVTRIVERCIQNGFISLWLLFNHRALALTPPLTITNEEIDEGMRLFKKSIAEAVK